MIGSDQRRLPRRVPPGRWWAVVAAALALSALSVGLGLLVRPTLVRLRMGGWPEYVARGDWARTRWTRARSEEVPDGRRLFYYRQLPQAVHLALPLRVAAGPVRISLRGSTNIHGRLELFVAGVRRASAPLRPGGRWLPHLLELPADALAGHPVELQILLHYAPLTRGGHVEVPRFLVESLEVSAPEGFRLGAGALATLGLGPLLLVAFGTWIGAPRGGLLTGALLALLLPLVVAAAPLVTLAAVPRLLGAALLGGILTELGLRRVPGAGRAQRTRLAAVVAAGIVFHGSLAFLPEHCPPDRDTHVARTLDLAGVPLSYHGLLVYGSHLPTASQTEAPATVLFGSSVLFPYPPLPYVAYFALHLAGLDLQWALTLLNVVLVMGIAPVLWVAASRIWDGTTAWMAVALYVLDLAVWHHVGRAHAPAAFGGALATAALAALAAMAGHLGSRSRWLAAGFLLGTATLGYASLAVLLGLFGLTLFGLLLVDARGLEPSERWALVAALVTGGLYAGVVYYFHYVPGLIAGARDVSALPDSFPGRSFLVFRNESRQSLRVWDQGYAWLLAAGLAAAAAALRRARVSARPVLLAWLGAWAAMMLLKDPLFFPRLLRWGKEDQFVSPLLCLFVAAGVAGLPAGFARRAAAVLLLAAAVFVQLRDFFQHAVTLRFL